jgi:hypothetical protein
MTATQENRVIKLFQKHLTCKEISEKTGLPRPEIKRLRIRWRAMWKEEQVREYLANHPSSLSV